MVKKYVLIDPEYEPPHLEGISEELDQLAKDKVLRVFHDYEKARTVNAGGVNVNIKTRWDELYKLYMSIRDEDMHNYLGQAQIFVPVTRRAVNIIESEASNALFSRDDYFSVEGSTSSLNEFDMREHAFNAMKHFSDTEDYISPFELALKQELIYGVTATRVQFKTYYHENISRSIQTTVLLDEFTGEPLVDPQSGAPKTRTAIVMQRAINEYKRPYVEAIDIYRLFINPLVDDPEKYDMVYQNAMTRDQLLQRMNEGVYSESQVKKLLEQSPAKFADHVDGNDGQGKASLIALVTEDKENDTYEVLQFEGLFIDAPDRERRVGDTIQATQFFIDIGNRNTVLRCQENPLIGQYKTFSLCNYDSMVREFYTDGVIDPIKGIQYEINDKENQSIDAVSFDLNAPFEVIRSSGLTDTDILAIYNTPHKALFVRERDSIRKVQAPVNVQHLSMEVTRLLGYVDNVTGSTSLAGGAPTGTQADRSGKALSLLQNQTRSQFSRLIRKFERRILERTLQKVWKMTMQYSDEEIAMKVAGDEEGKQINLLMSPAEIIGEYIIKVSGGSQYLKEREVRDGMLEFLSVAGMNDAFMSQLDMVPLLKMVAKSSTYNMTEFVNPNNLYQKQKAQIDQLTQAVQQSAEQIKMYAGEVSRLQSVVKQKQSESDGVQPVDKLQKKKQPNA